MSDKTRRTGDADPRSGVTRLSFLKASAGAAAGAAGAAAGAAAIGVPVAMAASDDQPGVPAEPSKPAPPEPVMAYVRDADRGEVTVVSGTEEATYRDRALVKRLLAAAPKSSMSNGGIDVLAP